MKSLFQPDCWQQLFWESWPCWPSPPAPALETAAMVSLTAREEGMTMTTPMMTLDTRQDLELNWLMVSTFNNFPFH